MPISKKNSTSSFFFSRHPRKNSIPHQDTVTGFLLAGTGHVDLRRQSNFFIVTDSALISFFVFRLFLFLFPLLCPFLFKPLPPRPPTPPPTKQQKPPSRSSRPPSSSSPAPVKTSASSTLHKGQRQRSDTSSRCTLPPCPLSWRALPPMLPTPQRRTRCSRG